MIHIRGGLADCLSSEHRYQNQTNYFYNTHLKRCAIFTTSYCTRPFDSIPVFQCLMSLPPPPHHLCKACHSSWPRMQHVDFNSMSHNGWCMGFLTYIISRQHISLWSFFVCELMPCMVGGCKLQFQWHCTVIYRSFSFSRKIAYVHLYYSWRVC